ncbi:MAG: acyltransferase [Candidatus Hodarchaeota archaeon]
MVINRVFYLIKNLLSRKSIYLFIKALKHYLEEHIIEISKLRLQGRTSIHPTVHFRCAENIIIGNNTRIQPYACLWASPNSKIIIGNNTGIGPHTVMFSSNHQYKKGEIYYNQPFVEKDIHIGHDVWIGARCVILAGVSIGDGSVIGAGSVVTRDIPPFSVAVGAPAKVLKDR